uniref:Pilus assembly protein n=1 Tax=Klebsiella pneumoniae TaxID=573 RepID=A0A8B0SR41_KLEPN|nr:Pilus assembly protein [Klebsiella pneumoniae]
MRRGQRYMLFNTAVSAICADCAAIIANIQDKLAALNKFAKDSCNATYEFFCKTGWVHLRSLLRK